MATPADSRHVPQRTASPREGALLREFQRQRGAGDLAGARATMAKLLTLTHDLIATVAKAERRRSDRASLRGLEADELVAEVTIRVMTRMAETFGGRQPGQFRAALVQATRFTCMDLARSELRHEIHRSDEPWEPGVEEGRSRLDRELERLAQEASGDEAAAGSAGDFLEWALPRISERRREVIILTHAGVPGDGVAARLGISRDLVYQERRRGLAELRRLFEEWADGP